MSDTPTPTPTTELTDEQVLEILNRYHEIARGNAALELVATELAGDGFFEVLDEVIDTAAELGYRSIEGPAWEKLRGALHNYGARLVNELETSKLKEGDRVRIVAALETKLGVMRHEEETRFVGSVPGMVEGTFRGMHPNERLSGWALVDVDAELVELAPGWTLEELGNPTSLVVPVHGAALERIQ